MSSTRRAALLIGRLIGLAALTIACGAPSGADTAARQKPSVTGAGPLSPTDAPRPANTATLPVTAHGAEVDEDEYRGEGAEESCVAAGGLQAVVDKDLASAAPAAELKADMLAMLTDGDFVSENWGTPEQRDILTASPEAIYRLAFAEGVMKP